MPIPKMKRHFRSRLVSPSRCLKLRYDTGHNPQPVLAPLVPAKRPPTRTDIPCFGKPPLSTIDTTGCSTLLEIGPDGQTEHSPGLVPDCGTTRLSSRCPSDRCTGLRT